MSLDSYMRTTLLRADDPRRIGSGHFLEPATVDDVLDGIDLALADGHYFDMEQWPFLHTGYLAGNFADLSAAFFVLVPTERLEECVRRMRDALQRSRFNEGEKTRHQREATA